MAYAVWAERITAEVRGAQQAAQMAALFGGEPEWPALDEVLTRFDEGLRESPVPVDDEHLELRRALGLRGPGHG